jgi:NAD(P)-dependent dehydrogenase (short-subunit alcohol dehydrogenase family)
LALITGATRGIGRAVAIRFAAEGCHPILVGRTQGALEETDDAIRALGGEASLIVGDIKDGTTIDQIGATIFQRWGHLDVLVANAGILGTLSPVGHIMPKDWDEVIATNLTANWRLIRSVDPLLRASAAARAIFVTSGVAAGRAYWGAYAVSKGALETLVRTYAHEISSTTIRANLLDPGAVRTRMRAKAYPGENPDTLKPADDADLMNAFVRLAEVGCEDNGTIVRL